MPRVSVWFTAPGHLACNLDWSLAALDAQADLWRAYLRMVMTEIWLCQHN